MNLSRTDYFKYLFNVYGLRRGTITKSWHDPTVVDLSGIDEEPVTGSYPIDFSQDDVPGLLTDENGVPMIDYASLGIHYNPWFVGHIALGRYTKWKKTKNDSHLDRFRILADWFVKNATASPNGFTWLYHFDWFGHDKPWRSGLSQAHGISTLLRAASIFSDAEYADIGKKAVDEMLSPMDKGGTLFHWPDGTITIEESVKYPPSTVLNGHLFSVIAAWEAGRFFDNDQYLNLAEKGWQFVLNNIDRYDLGYWSCYSLSNNKNVIKDIASPHYHEVHIGLFQVSAAITGNGIFNEHSKKFKYYQNDISCRLRAIWMKRLSKLTA